MKIVYVAAGAAGMYCGSCLHDNTLAASLIEQGHEVLLVPTYTPLRTDEADVSIRRIFFGGINVYLQQKMALFRHTPWMIDTLFDAPWLIRWATKIGPGVAADKLGDLTLSMLSGEEGRQRKEIAKLVEWLRHERPQIVHLSNVLLLGMARAIRSLGIPIVCTLSGEDQFLEKLSPQHQEQAWQLLRTRAADVDAFVALNRYYADFAQEQWALPSDRVHVIPHGLNLDLYKQRRPPEANQPRTIGYLARVCPDKGLHLLVEAAEQLILDKSLPPWRVRAAGYLAAHGQPYLRAIQDRTQSWSDPGRFSYLGEVDLKGKIAFLHSLEMLSVPTVYRESKGIFVLEALANAVPVVLPNHGAFPELISNTEGGLLHAPNDPKGLANALRELLLHPEQGIILGGKGRQAVLDQYRAHTMAQGHLRLYSQLVSAENS